MKTYDEKTWEEIQNPDLSAGRTYPSQRYIGTERRTHAGTIELYPPNGLQYEVPVYEDCLLYHAYTEEELAAMQTPEEPTPSEAPTWEEMADAYIEGGEPGMSMDAKTLVLDVLRSLGQREAAELRAGAADMDGTEIIAMERAAPVWDKQQDYTAWPKGAPVTHGEQVYTLITPHRAADYDGDPATLPALWNLCHTKDPTRAKPWFAPNGQSGMYMTGECYRAENGTVYRCKQDNCVWDADGLPSAWEEVQI